MSETSIGLHFFIGIPGPALDAPTRVLLREVRPGGVILFGRNVRSAAQLARLTAGLRRLLGRDLLICLDHEGGRVNRLKEIVGAVPSAPQLGPLGRAAWAAEHGRLTGRLLREVGVNANLAPVLDLALRPLTDNSVPDRCWSRDPSAVARLAGAFLGAMQREGILGCGKHFLGYGAADKDPHLVLPRVNRSRRLMLRDDLPPYTQLMSPPRARVGDPRFLPMIMLSHAHLRAFHGNKLTPACLSSELVEGVLRGRAKFRGVTITDDLEMGAITRTMPLPEAAARCLQNGMDFILICHTPKAIRGALRAVRRAQKSGLISEAVLEAGRGRILALKAQLERPAAFSARRFEAVKRDLHAFTQKIFARLPPKLRVIDERWGPIGEKY